MWLEKGMFLTPKYLLISILIEKKKKIMQDGTPENKLRLLMIYASVYPEKFEGDKASKLMQVATEFHFLDLMRPFLFFFSS